MTDVLSSLQSLDCDSLISLQAATGHAVQVDRQFGEMLDDLINAEMDRRIAIETAAEPADVVTLDLRALTLGDIRRAGLAVDAIAVPGAEAFLEAVRSALQAETGLRVRGTCPSGRCKVRRRVTA